jgi:protein-tyrosine phosphatase
MISLPRSESSFYTRMTDGPAFIRDRFGSGRGLARLALSNWARLAGQYRAFERVDWGNIDRLVFVCTGNICRSPYAERRAAAAGYPAISIALRGETGRAADPAARAAALRAGIDLGDHRSTEVDHAELRSGDLLVAMEPWQARMLRERFPGHQVTLLGLWTTPRRPHLHDPYTLSPAYFRTCFRLIDSGVAALLARTRA